MIQTMTKVTKSGTNIGTRLISVVEGIGVWPVVLLAASVVFSTTLSGAEYMNKGTMIFESTLMHHTSHQAIQQVCYTHVYPNQRKRKKTDGKMDNPD